MLRRINRRLNTGDARMLGGIVEVNEAGHDETLGVIEYRLRNSRG